LILATFGTRFLFHCDCAVFYLLIVYMMML
jgi:hypothetical protein